MLETDRGDPVFSFHWYSSDKTNQRRVYMRERRLYSASEIDRFHFCPEQSACR